MRKDDDDTVIELGVYIPQDVGHRVDYLEYYDVCAMTKLLCTNEIKIAGRESNL